MKAVKRHPLIVGTFILTGTGVISRLIGFVYRIYLSRLFGEEGMGIYQLLSPVLSLSFSLTAAGYQTAISRLVAERAAQKKSDSLLPLTLGLCITLPLSLVCNGVLYFYAKPIAVFLLREARTAILLRLLSFSIPFSAVHACINGYFYGIKKAGIPAGSQLLEQIARVGCVYIAASKCLLNGQTPSISIAVLGLTVGEFCSMLMTILAALSHKRKERASGLRMQSSSIRTLYGKLFAMALPLTANRIVLNFLQSIESVSIPSSLKLYGYDNTTALSVYGVLTGMAMPFIFFPNALTGSISVLLLPVISENYALGNMKAVRTAALRTVKYCGLLGLCCMAGFVLTGNWIGKTVYNSPLAGYFITTLGFLCPFLYLDTTLSSILQGLGLAGHIFVLNTISLLVRLGFVFLAVPRFGITGYLWGLLAGQLTLSLLYLGALHLFLKTHDASQ